MQDKFRCVILISRIWTMRWMNRINTHIPYALIKYGERELSHISISLIHPTWKKWYNMQLECHFSSFTWQPNQSPIGLDVVIWDKIVHKLIMGRVLIFEQRRGALICNKSLLPWYSPEAWWMDSYHIWDSFYLSMQLVNGKLLSTHQSQLTRYKANNLFWACFFFSFLFSFLIIKFDTNSRRKLHCKEELQPTKSPKHTGNRD
jgi:hypothetical protein